MVFRFLAPWSLSQMKAELRRLEVPAEMPQGHDYW